MEWDINLYSLISNYFFLLANLNIIRRRRSRHAHSSNQIHDISRRDQNGENSANSHRTADAHAIMQRTEHEGASTNLLETDTDATNTQDQNGENSFDLQRTADIHEIRQTQHEGASTILLHSDSDATNTQDQDGETSSQSQRTANTHAIMQNLHAGASTILLDSDSDTTITEEVAAVYEVPEDDYGYLSTDNDNESSSVQGLPYHTVDWTSQESNSTSSQDVCTVCYANDRTHIFIPCGHLACCMHCLERLEAKRCPICNTNYEQCIRVLKP